jgi:hypothetical protein
MHQLFPPKLPQHLQEEGWINSVPVDREGSYIYKDSIHL